MAQPKTAFLFACPSRASLKADGPPPLPEPPPEKIQATETTTRMNLFLPKTQMKGRFPPRLPLTATGRAYVLTSSEDNACKHLTINVSTENETNNKHRPVALPMSDVSCFPIDRLGFTTVSFQQVWWYKDTHYFSFVKCFGCFFIKKMQFIYNLHVSKETVV